MNIGKLENLFGERGYPGSQIQMAIFFVRACQEKLDCDIDDASVDQIKEYVQTLVEQKENSMERLLALARYFYANDLHEIYLYFTTIFGSLGVVEEIKKRIISIYGEDRAKSVFEGLIMPPLGIDTSQMPRFTNSFMESLSLWFNKYELKKVLAGNNHQVPVEAMLEEKQFYLKASNIDEYLKERHQRKVEELNYHMNEGKIWFEQIITPDVVAYVKKNQEILSAVREGNKLYVTKIPYDTKAFLESSTDIEKRYNTCHCPFVKEALLEEEEMDPDWCYCSAGFAKFPFEVILDEDLEVEVLETPLKGDLMCRFAITLPEKVKTDDTLTN